jgi:pyruvate formate lyase activating enzyme
MSVEILKNTFIDYPGVIATMLFLPGCNLSCPYCQNKEIAASPKETLDWNSIRDYLETRKGKNEGVVLSGGEPTIYEDIGGIASKIRSMGFCIKLDTNGLLPDRIREVSPDYLALDIKSVPEAYKLLGSWYPNVKDRLSYSIEIVRSMKDKAEIKITLSTSPLLINKTFIKDIGEMIKGVSKVYLQQVRIISEGISVVTKFDTNTFEYQDILSNYVDECILRY